MSPVSVARHQHAEPERVCEPGPERDLPGEVGRPQRHPHPLAALRDQGCDSLDILNYELQFQTITSLSMFQNFKHDLGQILGMSIELHPRKKRGSTKGKQEEHVRVYPEKRRAQDVSSCSFRYVRVLV